MSIFINEKLVNGDVISGRIKNEKFFMTGLNPSNIISPPIKLIEFNKEWLDITIKELELVREEIEKNNLDCKRRGLFKW